MAAGKSWKLTERRKREALKMLKMQHTTASIAAHFGINFNTLHNRFKEASIDPKVIANNGKIQLRTMLFQGIAGIEDDTKRTDMGLKYLDRYPIEDDNQDTTQAVDTTSIKIEIMTELQGK